MTATNTRPLRIALVANAVFSLTTAALMILFPSLVGDWLGISAPLILQAIGIGLVIFAADLLHQATRNRVATWRALYASAADYLWVAGTFALLALFPGALSLTGNAIVLSVSLAVFVFGSWQLWAIGQAHKRQDGDLFRHCIQVAVNAPADAMWRVISRIGDIKQYMPSLIRSEVLNGRVPGVGAVRMCEDRKGKQWAEVCTEFETGRSFTVRFLSEAPDFPFPAKTMHGGWEVTPADGGSNVTVWWELEPKPKLLAPILLPLLAFQVNRDFPKIVRRMAADALGQTREVAFQESSGAVAGLVPNLC
jgi:hypothetical protein